MFDAEGQHEHEPCPSCGSRDTVTFRYPDGDCDLECRNCNYRSDQQELSELLRYTGELLERRIDDAPLVPVKKIEA